jgi:hypothetical protein
VAPDQAQLRARYAMESSMGVAPPKVCSREIRSRPRESAGKSDTDESGRHYSGNKERGKPVNRDARV